MMKAVAFIGKRNIQVIDLKRPEVKDNGVLINMKACGICGTDMHTYHSGKFAEFLTKSIHGYKILGHEFSGEIIEVGKDVKMFNVGDRVASVHNKGGMSEYIEVHGKSLSNLYTLSTNVSFEAAATLEPLCSPMRAFYLRKPLKHEVVAIFGAGIIGLSYLQIIKAKSEATVIVTDISSLRLEAAKTLGADIVIHGEKENPVKKIKEFTGEFPVRYHEKTTGGCDISIDCAGVPITIRQALEVLKSETSTAILLALYTNDINVDLNTIVLKNISLFGSMSYSEIETERALDLITSGKVHRDILITQKYPIEEAEEAFVTQADSRKSIKVMLSN